MAAEPGGDHLDRSVIVQIAKGRATSRDQRGRSWIGRLQSAVAIQCQQGWLQIVQRRVNLFHVIEDVTLRDEQVLLSVIIKIFQPYAPPRGYARKHGHTGLQTAIAECAVSFIVKYGVRLTGQRGEDDTRNPVFV